MAKENMIESHPLHPEHPIFRKTNQEEFLCNLCLTNADATKTSYSCDHCNFNLHVFCAKRPPTLVSPFHPDHTLVFVSGYKCQHCNESLVPQGLDYGCDSCNIYLHLPCHYDSNTPMLNLPKTTRYEKHPHQLTLVRKESAFKCGHCKNNGQGARYSCATFYCKFSIHVYCGNEPRRSIRSPFHPQHDLTLASWHKEHCCHACLKIVQGGFYTCKTRGCDFIIHPVCHERSVGGCSSYLPEDSPGSERTDFYNPPPVIPSQQSRQIDAGVLHRRTPPPYVDPAGVFFRNLRIEPPPSERRGGSNYFFMHPAHDLVTVRFGDRPAPNIGSCCEVCEGALMGDCHSCISCGFFVHEPCFEVAKPAVIDSVHPMHILHYIQANNSQCRACNQVCTNWRFYCAFCNSHFHVFCLRGSVPSTTGAGSSAPPASSSYLPPNQYRY